ncbi:hypothetical protein NQ318_014409 [Aromia moschata]|uniref:lysozyme n=1 Tax=Aromia moschata TaxID=1265417 RepID=A0AAV8Y9G0_9CUCU|nr:hypothetical protein NQ318_014409 [Aromia moschata]
MGNPDLLEDLDQRIWISSKIRIREPDLRSVESFVNRTYKMVHYEILTFTVLSLVLTFSEGKVFGRCELAKKLLQNNVPKNQIPTWLCIAKHESGYDNTKINWQTGDHGVFQISQIYWCSTDNQPGKACQSTCASFRDENLNNDIACVRKIYEEHQRLSGNGFNAWTVYSQSCKGDNSQYVKGCF